MTLYIDTTGADHIFLEVIQDDKTLVQKKIKADRDQAEKLLPLLAKMLAAKKIKLKDLKGIVVCNEGGTFTSLRIGVIVANALAFALQIPVRGTKGKSLKTGKVSVVSPFYSAKPNIS